MKQQILIQWTEEKFHQAAVELADRISKRELVVDEKRASVKAYNAELEEHDTDIAALARSISDQEAARS